LTGLPSTFKPFDTDPILDPARSASKQAIEMLLLKLNGVLRHITRPCIYKGFFTKKYPDTSMLYFLRLMDFYAEQLYRRHRNQLIFS
jgi:hypothetical protein